MCRQCAVAGIVGRAPWRCENGSRVAPYKHPIEKKSSKSGGGTWRPTVSTSESSVVDDGRLTEPAHPRGCRANHHDNPYCPSTDAIDKGQREVSGTGTAVSLDSAGQASRHFGGRRGRLNIH